MVDSVNAKSDCCSKSADASQIHTLRTFLPLIGVLSFVCVLCLGVLLLHKDLSVMGFMTAFSGAFFLTFGSIKLIAWMDFAKAFKKYDPLAKMIPAYSYLYPFIEIGLGIFYILNIMSPYIHLTAFVILLITSMGVARALKSGQSFQCACIGTKFKLPISKVTIIENVVMMVMTFWMFLNQI